MFICSFKLNKTRLVSGVAALCLALTLVFLALPDDKKDLITSGAIGAKSQQEMAQYLDTIGFTVTPQAVLIEQITIPETFDETYNKYNDLQKEAGFDLSKFAGAVANKYTFRVLNYPDEKPEIVANLLIVDGKIVGGDISSTELGGFCKALKKENLNSDNSEKPKE